jgi:hypothetical protein
MMLKSRILIPMAVVAIIAFATVVSQTRSAKADPGIPDSADAKQIMATVERAYRLFNSAGRTGDVSEFPAVFTDTADYPYTDALRQQMATEFGVEAKDVQGAGYLTAIMARYVAQGRAAQQLQAALAKARAENREITTEELQQVAASNQGILPPYVLDAKTTLTYESIEIDGDRATVRYDDEAALQEAILVRLNGNWLIASMRPIKIHF